MLQLWYMEEVVEKAHKYIKRVPTGKPKPKYRYFYKMPKGGLVSSKDLVVGSSFQYGSGEERSHYKVTSAENGQITLTHAKTGDSRTATFAQLKDLLDTDRLEQADPKQEQQAQTQSKAEEKPSENKPSSAPPQASESSQDKGNNFDIATAQTASPIGVDAAPDQFQTGGQFDIATAETPLASDEDKKKPSTGFKVETNDVADQPSMNASEVAEALGSVLTEAQPEEIAPFTLAYQRYVAENGKEPSKAMFDSLWQKIKDQTSRPKKESVDLREFIPSGKNISPVEKAASFLKKQLQSLRSGTLDQASPMPADTQSMGQVKTKDELFATGKPRELGKGAYGEVFGDAGPPPRAYKYGEINKEDFEIGVVAGELGLGAKIIAGQVGTKSTDANKEGRVEMEFLENHKTVWTTFIEQGHMDTQGRIVDRPETRKAYGNLSKKTLQKMQALHLAGYSHNDSHFGNLLFAPDGELKLIDYGLARKGYKSAYHELFGPLMTNMFQGLEGVREGAASEVFELRQNLENYVRKNIPPTGDTSALYAQAILMFHDGLNQIIGEKELI